MYQSVNKGLPRFGKVLVTNGANVYICGVAELYCNGNDGKTYLPTRDGKQTEVTHWMPLPTLENQTYTLEEIAKKICDSYEECEECGCPGFAYCRHDKKGALVWLQSVVDGNKGG